MNSKVHPRTFIVGSAEAELGKAMLDIVSKYDLSPAELAFIMSQKLASWSASAVRLEREYNEQQQPFGE